MTEGSSGGAIVKKAPGISLSDPEVEISELPYDPDNSEWGAKEASAYLARISHDKQGRSAKEIWGSEKKEYREGLKENLKYILNRLVGGDYTPKKLEEEQAAFLERLADMGHSSCFYQANVGLNYEIPRQTTMFLCQFDHPKYLQQSQRYTEASDFIIENEQNRGLFQKQKELYNDMVEDENEDIEKEDARYILPLGVAAKHLHQNTNFVGLSNIRRVISSENSKVPEISSDIFNEAIDKLNKKEPVLFNEELMDRYNRTGNGYPVANMFSEGNKWVDETLELLSDDDIVLEFVKGVDGELFEQAKNLNDEAASFLNLDNSLTGIEGYTTKMSLSAWHQFMRNDTVKQSVESVYDAAERREPVIPKTVEGSGYEDTYIDLFEESMDCYEGLSQKHGKEAVEVVPHGLNIGVAFSLDGFNWTKGFIEDRAQESAQWEIRDIASELKNRSY